MASLERIKEDDSLVGLAVATLLIVAWQVAALIPLIAIPLEQYLTVTQILLPTNITWLAAYFTIPIIYYVGVSHLFNPKRIVSPFYAQVGTISVITMMLTYKTATTITASLSLVETLMFTVAFFAIFLAEVGYLQLLVVRWVVGLNYDSVDRASFLIEGVPPAKMIDLLGESFIDTFHFSKPNHIRNVWIFGRWDTRSRSSLIIGIGEQTGNANNSILATVAFQKGIYVMKKDKKATDIRDEVINDVKGKLASISPGVQLKAIPIEQLNDDASSATHNKAIDITVSRLGVFAEKTRTIPSYYRILIGFTLFALVCLALAQLLNYGSFVDLIGTLVIALVIEIGLPLRDELRGQFSRRKNEK